MMEGKCERRPALCLARNRRASLSARRRCLLPNFDSVLFRIVAVAMGVERGVNHPCHSISSIRAQRRQTRRDARRQVLTLMNAPMDSRPGSAPSSGGPSPPLEALGVGDFYRELWAFWKRRRENPFFSEGMRRLDRRRWGRYVPLIVVILLLVLAVGPMVLGMSSRGAMVFGPLAIILGVGAAFVIPPLAMVFFGRIPGDAERQEKLLVTHISADEWAFGALYPAFRWALRWQLAVGLFIFLVLLRLMIVEGLRSGSSSFDLGDAMFAPLLMLLYVGCCAVMQVSSMSNWLSRRSHRWLVLIISPISGLVQGILALSFVLILAGMIAILFGSHLFGHGGFDQLAVVLLILLSVGYALLWMVVIPWRRLRLIGALYFRELRPERLAACSWFAAWQEARRRTRDGLPVAPWSVVYRSALADVRNALLFLLCLYVSASLAGTAFAAIGQHGSRESGTSIVFEGLLAFVMRAAITPFGLATAPALFVALFLYLRGRRRPDGRVPVIVGVPIRSLLALLLPVIALWLPVVIFLGTPQGIGATTEFDREESLIALTTYGLFGGALALLAAAALMLRRSRAIWTWVIAGFWWVGAVTFAGMLRRPPGWVSAASLSDLNHEMAEFGIVLLVMLCSAVVMALLYGLPWLLDRWQTEECAGLEPGSVTTDGVFGRD